jgi:broad specificity phosphatase PhoE
VLILVRHGRTAYNASGRLLGRLDVPLDELGRRQAKALSGVAEIAGADRVITSPLTRARQTAEALGPPVSVDDRWIEVDYGAYDGMVLDEVPPDLWQRWKADPEWAPEGGEALAAVVRRVSSACADLVADAAVHDVVVVSHVSPIKAALAWALGTTHHVHWRMFLDTASVCRVEVVGAAPSLRSFNETHHRPSA